METNITAIGTRENKAATLMIELIVQFKPQRLRSLRTGTGHRTLDLSPIPGLRRTPASLLKEIASRGE